MKYSLRDVIRSSAIGRFVRLRMAVPARHAVLRFGALFVSFHDKRTFRCPFCSYRGIFLDAPISSIVLKDKIRRKYAFCPNCMSAERHRLQYFVLKDFFEKRSDLVEGSALHFAPENNIQSIFRRKFQEYKTADLHRQDVDLNIDMSRMNLPDGCFDFIYASHVLEHVPDDMAAISEVSRVLTSGGIAILPIPIYADGNVSNSETVEYGRPRPEEEGHVRAPGLDYFDRFRTFFSDVEVYSTNNFKAEAADCQLYILKYGAGSTVKIPDYVSVCRGPVRQT